MLRPTASEMPEEQHQESGAEYYILPDDPLAALNILREAAGLQPPSQQGMRTVTTTTAPHRAAAR